MANKAIQLNQAERVVAWLLGAQLYARGQVVLQKWITTQYNETRQPLRCIGQSLGGAMALHCHIHQPAQVDFVALNPPGLTHREARIYKKNPAIAEIYPANRTLQIISHCNDGAWNIGSRWIPPHASFLRHGDLRENPYIAHIKAADFSQAALDLGKQDHEKPQRSIFWKLFKPLLFLAVIILHIIAWPIRFVIALITTICDSQATPTPIPNCVV